MLVAWVVLQRALPWLDFWRDLLLHAALPGDCLGEEVNFFLPSSKVCLRDRSTTFFSLEQRTTPVTRSAEEVGNTENSVHFGV